MDFGALPPEINSARMYSGPGSGSMLAAAAAWDSLAEDLHSTAASYSSVISGLAGQWLGPSSSSMTAAATPYIGWMSATAAQAEQSAIQVRAAAAAYQAAFAMTVPPPVIAANRSLLMSLVATNFLGQNTPAIAATEAHYSEMWVQDAAAMYGYAGNSAAASTLSPFTTPTQVTNPGAAAAQTTSAATGTETQGALAQLTTVISQTLQSLAVGDASSGSDTGTSGMSSLSSIDGLSSLMMPLRMATMPLMMLSRMLMMGGMGGMGAAGAKTVSAGVDAVAPTLAAGAASGAGLLGPAGLGELVVSTGPAAAPVSAGLDQALPVGALSVPQSWNVATPTLVSATTAMPNVAATPAAGASLDLSGLPPMMPIANMAGRDAGETAPQLDLHQTVMVRSPIGG
ncbi:MAG: PPE family protein [Mycobacterium sp.]